jgi:hypothetical protein
MMSSSWQPASSIPPNLRPPFGPLCKPGANVTKLFFSPSSITRPWACTVNLLTAVTIATLMRRSTVLSFPLQLVFPARAHRKDGLLTLKSKY